MGRRRGSGCRRRRLDPQSRARVAVRAGTGGPSAPDRQYKRLGPSPRTCPSQNGGRERAEVTFHENPKKSGINMKREESDGSTTHRATRGLHLKPPKLWPVKSTLAPPCGTRDSRLHFSFYLTFNSQLLIWVYVYSCKHQKIEFSPR
ncbi:uncharacterized protein LOC142876849 isoform X2 [Microcebus murinus]|uniref:uncharacterized protein LOC142876849 isoform X2 n=1 Tax=Microcebus murinus TaxID=30608 RepID=UPI003F6BDEDC